MKTIEDNFGKQDPHSANFRIRELINEATRDGTNISLVYKDTLRAIKNLCGGFFTKDSEDKIKPVKAIVAGPERSIAKQLQEDNIILPIISVNQPQTNLAPDRQKYLPLVIEEKLWDDKKQRAFRVVSLAPKPIDILYDISVWSKYKNDLDQITEQIHSKFNPSWEITTPESNIIKVFLGREIDDSTIKVGDREDRILRRLFSLEVQTYVPTPKFLYTSTGKIEKFNYDFDVENKITDE